MFNLVLEHILFNIYNSIATDYAISCILVIAHAVVGPTSPETLHLVGRYKSCMFNNFYYCCLFFIIIAIVIIIVINIDITPYYHYITLLVLCLDKTSEDSEDRVQFF